MVTPTLYGITGFALILFSWALLREALIFHSRDRTRITPENVRAAVRDWLDKFHFGVQVIAPEDGALFRFASTSAAGTNVAIIQAKNNPQYLFLKSSLVLTEQEQRQIAELPNHGEAAVIRQLRMTLASFKIS
jgi:hypothetical protein